jgi:chemotaxis signal transduction protein
MRRRSVSSPASKPEKLQLESRVAELRRGFDESFAVPPQMHDAALEQMLAITLQGERYAIRINEISGLAVPKGKVLPVPSSVPELLGLTGIRGTVVPVFSLALLLGFGQSANASAEDTGSGEARWLVFARTPALAVGSGGGKPSLIALAFDEMEQQFAVPAALIYPRGDDQPGTGARRYVCETVNDGDGLRGVISIPPMVEYIKARGASGTM